jgi:hypothetical protein
MNAERPHTPLSVPTLTEVVAVADPGGDPADAQSPPAHGADAVDPGRPSAPTPVDLHLDEVEQPALHADALPDAPGGHARTTPLPTDSQLTQQVLADVSRQIELMLEYRMREALAPILARATDTMIRDARNQLVNTLHEMVARAVAQEMSRHRDR